MVGKGKRMSSSVFYIHCLLGWAEEFPSSGNFRATVLRTVLSECWFTNRSGRRKRTCVRVLKKTQDKSRGRQRFEATTTLCLNGHGLLGETNEGFLGVSFDIARRHRQTSKELPKEAVAAILAGDTSDFKRSCRTSRKRKYAILDRTGTRIRRQRYTSKYFRIEISEPIIARKCWYRDINGNVRLWIPTEIINLRIHCLDYVKRLL